MEIKEYIVEKIVDPTGLISGERYEFRLFVMLNEEDELYSENGVGVRAILAVDEGEDRLVVAHFFDRATDEAFDFELEDEELSTIQSFCKVHYHEAE
ncbi:DUF6509 family protein [Sporosarcina pasteurii]|uniref:Pullulanase n=1 Tax=Sporosarcina pasteurii TaxID=1474 RepID=A0A380C3S3_SPOPA|nr:DUF6509 family protein [Sporosarcina pasteurii]MDS9471704.1 DUF6509 family protein [Sporosarcina pasteurii]QBQ04695.1 pullulanase [Sporosarcina pasteurii]SUJ12223.1 Uncharacterised protein [Sporosarcina pasteurii]